MKKQLLSRKRLLPLFYSLCLMLVCANVGWGQTTILDETFGTVANSSYAGLTSTIPSNIPYTVTLNNGAVSTGLVSGNGFLNLASAGTTTAPTRPNLTAPFSSLSLGSFSTTLANNTLPVEWTVNMKVNRVMSSNSGTGYNDNSYYLVVVLCSNSANLITAPTGTNGYALILQRKSSLTTNALRLVKFTNGLITGSSGVPVGTSATTLLAETPLLTTTAPSTTTPNNLSVKVVYTPTGDSSTGTWELFYREDSGATFVDPASGSLTSAGISTDNAYTTTAMTHFGFLGSLSTSAIASNQFQIDNFKIKGGAATTPSITSTVGSLSGFAYNQGSGPSTGQSFTVTGTNLTNNLVVTPSTNYEISDDAGTNYNSLARTYAPSSGTVTDKVIFTRLKTGLTANAYNETITVASSGANVLAGGGVACSGGVTGLYYYNGTGALSTAVSWGSNTDGSGTAPVFGNYQNLIIRNATSVTTDAAWTFSGTGSKIILGDSTQPAVTLTVVNGFPITGTIDIPAALSGSNSLVLQDLLIQPTFGALDDTSEVHLQAAGVTSVTYTNSASFGKLFVDGLNSNVTISGNLIIKKSLSVSATGRLFMSGTSTLFTVINAGGSVAIDGYLKIGKTAGLYSANVTTPASGSGSLQFKDATANLTLGSASTIEYSRGTASSSQVISVLPTGVNYANLIISDSNANCPKSFAGPIAVTGTFTLNQGASALTGGGSLTLASGATIVRTAGSFDVAPIFGAKVNVTYNGAAAINSGVEIPVATTVLNNLTVATTAAAAVTLTTLTSLNNKLTVTTGSLATAGLLTLKSSECCTAYVAPVLSPEVTAISGNVIVERYIPAGFRAYRLLSPATTGGTINANWQEGGLVTTIGGISNPILTFGTHITGAGGSANGFDTTTINAASVFTYNNATPAWTALANTSGTLTAGSPYLVYIRGSRLATNVNTSLGNDVTTLRTTGTLTTGTVPVSSLNASAGGFSLVGNPYQAQVDMSKVLVTNATAVNLTPFYYVVDIKLGGKGAYATIDLVTLANSTAVDANQYLQPGQACFVQTVLPSAASFNFTEADKFEGTQTSVFRTKNIATARLLLTLNDASAKALDRLVVTFDASESNDVNQNDASKMTNFDESMATSNNGKLLSIEKRAMPTDSDEIPLNITKYRGTSYTIKAEGTGLTGSTPYLFDQFNNKTVEIPQNGSVNYAYTIDVAIAASIAANRFKLIYAKSLQTIDNDLGGFTLYPNPSKSNSFSVAVPQSMSKVSLSVSNLLGQQIYSQNDLQSGTTVKVTASNVKTSGVYLVSLTAEGKTATTKWIVE